MSCHYSFSNRRQKPGKRRLERGAAMVELAVVAPLLLGLFFGIAEVGRALVLHHLLVDQVESATRFLGRYYQAVDSSCATTASWPTALSTAQNIVVYGNEAGGSKPIISGMTAGNITASVAQKTLTGTGATSACVVSLSARVTYPGIFGTTVPLFGIAMPKLKADSQERYVGQ